MTYTFDFTEEEVITGLYAGFFGDEDDEEDEEGVDAEDEEEDLE